MVLIQTSDDLARLLESAVARSPFTRETVVLELERLQPSESHIWQRRLNRHQRACGCGTASVLSITAGIAVVIHSVLTTAELSMGAVLLAASELIAGMLIFMFLGKIIGLHVAKYRFRSACVSLLRELSGQAS